MRIHPYIENVEIILNGKEPVVITLDKEYGFLSWRMKDGVLMAADITHKQSALDLMFYEPFVRNEMPAGGDAAIALENDTADLVEAIFKLITESEFVQVRMFAKLANEAWLVVKDGDVFVWSETVYQAISDPDSDSLEPGMDIRVHVGELEKVV